MPSLLTKMKILSKLVKNFFSKKLNFSLSTLFHKKARVSLKYFIRHCLEKHFFASNASQTSSNLIFFASFSNSKTFKTLLI